MAQAFDRMAQTMRRRTPPSYAGEILHQCLKLNWDATWYVVVSGAAWNPCGHSLLNVGGRGGWYFHIGEWVGKPLAMLANDFSRYLQDERKTELVRKRLEIPDPAGADAKLNELAAKTWVWWVLPHNCAAFIEDVVSAGGNKSMLWSNCPTRESFR